MRSQNIAVVGATGAVGVEILRVLERRDFRVASLRLLASRRSAGKTLEFKGKPHKVEELTAQLVSGELIHGPAVRTELSVDPLVIDPDRLAPLALFAVEAITNAQKHAFAHRGGVLTLTFIVRGEEAELTIADDGAAADDALVAAGVGRTLMTAFARQLRGRAELVRNAKGGVTARLIFPTPATADSLRPGNQAAA